MLKFILVPLFLCRVWYTYFSKRRIACDPHYLLKFKHVEQKKLPSISAFHVVFTCKMISFQKSEHTEHSEQP